MRIRIVVLTLLALSVVPTWGGAAQASCAAPTLTLVGQEDVPRPQLRVGTQVTVRGTHFVDGCNDTPDTDTKPGARLRVRIR